MSCISSANCSLDNLLWDGTTLNGFEPYRTHYGVRADYNDPHTIDFYLHDNSASIVEVYSQGGSWNKEFNQGNHYRFTMKSTNYFGHGYLMFVVKGPENSPCECEAHYTIEW